MLDLAKQKGDKEAGLEEPVRYALVYEGAIQLLKEGGYEDAVLLEFGEKGYKSFSAYSLVHGKAKVTSLCGLILLQRGSLSHFCNEKAAFIEISGRSRHVIALKF